MTRTKIVYFISILITLLLTAFIIALLTGKGIFYFMIFKWIILSLILGYIVVLVFLISNWIKKGEKYKWITLVHLTPLIILLLYYTINLEIFKSKKLLEARLVDDLSVIKIVLRENGKFENTAIGLFFITETFKGKYERTGDTIFFKSQPYSNDFISNRVLISEDKHRIYFRLDDNGDFITKETNNFYEYFDIDYYGFK
jgi:hypothetical protein